MMRWYCRYKVANDPQTVSPKEDPLYTQQVGFATLYSVSLHSKEPLDAERAVTIDIPYVEGLQRWMANYRWGRHWCKTAFGSELSRIPDNTQWLLYQKWDGLWGVLLPLVGDTYKGILCGNGEDGMTVRLFSQCEGLCECVAPAFLMQEGEDPFSLLADCAKTAAEVLGTNYPTREGRPFPEQFEYLGWCSWDAMQIRVNEKDLLQKCREFREKSIPVRWMILDDMWAEIRPFHEQSYANLSEMFRLMHTSPLYAFEADPLRFPDGLRSCIDKLHAEGMKVGMWHPTTGYWFGIDPNGPVYRELKEHLYYTGDRYVHGYQEENAYAFYHAFHQFLHDCGADFLKVDNQSVAETYYKGCTPIGQVSRALHRALERSVEEQFGGVLINCMGMSSECMFNRPRSAISRCSDDFQPENREWFTQHLLMCSYNGLTQGQFFWNDWDMWWSCDSQARKNSVLRAVSGGPIYISDPLDRSVKEMLDPLTLSDGRILRCDRPAMPTYDMLLQDPERSEKPFKVQNICANGGVLALFNIRADNTPVCGTISPADIEELLGERFAVYEHFSGRCHILARQETLSVWLKDNDDLRLYTVVPLHEGFAAIGLVDKYIPLKTIRRVEGRQVELCEHGRYGYIQDEVLHIELK